MESKMENIANNNRGWKIHPAFAWEGPSTDALNFDIYTNSIRTSDGVKIDDRKALLRKDKEGNKVYLATVSNDYVTLKHSDIIKKVEEANFILPSTKIKTILSNDGVVMQRSYTMFDRAIEVRPGDAIAPSLRIINSYDGSRSVGFMLDALRLVCTNGMVGIKQFMHVQYRHFGAGANINTIFGQLMLKAMDSFNDYSDNWARWIGYPVEDFRVELAVNYMPSRIRPLVMDRISKDFEGDKWSLYNCFTAAITHDYAPSRAFCAEAQKIELGAICTKLFTNDFVWTADKDRIIKDLIKRRLIKDNTDKEIDADVRAFNDEPIDVEFKA